MTIVYYDCLDCDKDFEIEQQEATSVISSDYENDEIYCLFCKSDNIEIDFISM